MGGDGRGKLL
ncbi:hypothetical protein S40285_10942, partial [Stachybotrys chlorohalonatus IBT 40285]